MSIRKLLNTFGQFSLPYDRLNVPIFRIASTNVEIIRTPGEFYDTLKNLTVKSRKRIYFSSLYIGTGPLEKSLVGSLVEAKVRHPELDLAILLDFNRATRETKTILEDKREQFDSSRSILKPLVAQGANVSFYLSPNLSGWWRQWIARRQRWNELTSLHHMKLYIFDDDVIISGANLSETYFTNRQDRYVIIKGQPKVADYFADLINTIGKFSFSLKADGRLELRQQWKFDPRRFRHDYKFRRTAQLLIKDLNLKHLILNQNSTTEKEIEEDDKVDTVIFPLLQLNAIGVRDEEMFTKALLRYTLADAHLTIATGYFNLTKLYQNLLRQAKYDLTILMASEEANGFWEARGALYYVPYVYTQYLKSFMQNFHSNQMEKIKLYYYCRPEWSFHAKGIWLETAHSLLATIGSSNLGYRSVYRDNELQIVLLTKDKQLRQAFLHEAKMNLIKDSRRVMDPGKDLPNVPFWVKCYAFIFRSYF